MKTFGLAVGAMTVAMLTGTGCLPIYSVGGQVTGLDAIEGDVVLDLNGSETLTLSADGNFVFATTLARTAAYAVSVATQPAQGHCEVVNGAGAIGTGNITDVQVNCTPVWVGDKQFGAAYNDEFAALVIDNTGSLVTAGSRGSELFPGGPITPAGVIAKYTAWGELLWRWNSREQLTWHQVRFNDVVVDAAGNVYAAGTQEPVSWQVLVVKLGPDGTLLWNRLIDSTGSAADKALALTLRGDDELVVTGFAYSDPFEGVPHAPADSTFVGKLATSDGSTLWTAFLPGSLQLSQIDVAANSMGDSIVATSVYDTGFVVAYHNDDGDEIWRRDFAATALSGLSVAVDGNDDIYVTGSATALDGGAPFADRDVFVLKLDGSGNTLASTTLVSSGDDYATDNITDGANHLVVTGYTALNLAGATSAGGIDLITLKWDETGNLLWARQHGTAGDDYASAVTVDASGAVTVGGSTTGAFDGYVNTGSTDEFLVRFDADGTRQ